LELLNYGLMGTNIENGAKMTTILEIKIGFLRKVEKYLLFRVIIIEKFLHLQSQTAGFDEV